MSQFSLIIIVIAVSVTILLVANRKKAMESNRDNGSTTVCQTLQQNYEAPLISDPQVVKIPKRYWVVFHPGHKLVAHDAAIGLNIEPHIRTIFAFGKGIWEGGRVHDGVIMKPFTELDYPPADLTIHYEGQDIDEKLLAAIRSDPGVQSVSFSHHIQAETNVG
jgi:hypothetical protein